MLACNPTEPLVLNPEVRQPAASVLQSSSRPTHAESTMAQSHQARTSNSAETSSSTHFKAQNHQAVPDSRAQWSQSSSYANNALSPVEWAQVVSRVLPQMLPSATAASTGTKVLLSAQECARLIATRTLPDLKYRKVPDINPTGARMPCALARCSERNYGT